MTTPRLAAALSVIAAVSSACMGEPGTLVDQRDTPMVARSATRPVIINAAVERGRQLTDQSCTSCHATGSAGASPMEAATPFREIVHRYPLDQLEEAFAEGLVTGHPAMPEFVFRAGEIDDLIAYLESLKSAS
jgi:mono/diheme cytochrome c family protein